LMRALQPDMIHLHSSKAGLIGRLAALGRGVPLLFQPHGWSFEAVTGSLRRTSVLWERLGSRVCDRIISVSEAERERGRRAGIRARMEVVLNGVSTDVWPAAARVKPRSAARTELGLPPGPLVVCVGRLCEAKGQDLLLAAWPRIVDRVPSAHLVLVGEGTDTDRLRMPVGTGVLFAGRQEDVSTWLAAADVVVAPSRREGLSLAVLEAMAMGRSVVATDVDGMRELLGAVSGCVVPPGDPATLVAPVVARLQDPDLAAVEGSMASRRARELFDVRRTYDILARLYQEVYEEAYRAAVVGWFEGSRQAVRV
jgi:glycosyltransferase involved in cell wall biosynthesis